MKVFCHFRDDREESYDERLGEYSLNAVPREGDYIWFPKKVVGFSSWVVVDVCHWVGCGEVCVYISPEKKL